MEKEIKYPKDIKGKVVKVGDKVRGFGSLKCQDGWSIDRTPTVTVNIQGEFYTLETYRHFLSRRGSK
jgi:hypothetical protein